MDSKTKSPLSVTLKIGLSSILLIIIIYILITLFSRMFENLYIERKSNTQLLMEQIALNLEDSLDNQMVHAENFARVYQEGQYTTLDESYQYLQTMMQIGGANLDDLYLIDNNAYCYSYSDVPFRWRNTKLLLSKESSCLLSSMESSISSKDCILFLVPLSDQVVLNECIITHIVMSIDTHIIDKFFDVEYFGQGNTGFILNETGSQAYLSDNDSELSQIYNILNALESAKFKYGYSIDKVKDDIENGKAGCVLIEFKNKSYYFSYEPFGLNNWTAAMLIEEQYIVGSSNSFVSSLVITIGFISIITVFIIACIIIISTRASNKRLLIAKEAEQKAEAEHNANAAKSRFLSSMSHDIRTPMNAIIGMSHLAITNIDNKKYALDCLDKVQRSSEHLLTLINDILDISKIESGKMNLNPSNFILENEIKKLIDIINPQIEKKGHDFICEMNNVENKIIYADKLRLNQILLNLLSNAVKYTQNNGKIEFKVNVSESEFIDDYKIVFTISDNGVGMSKEFQKVMYDTFSRDDSKTLNNIQGTGLGLSICKQMIELLDGKIECNSNVGVGTTFVVTLNLQKAIENDEITNESIINNNEHISLNGLRVVIAEDNDFNWEIAKAILEEQGIYTIRAVNGEECVNILLNSQDNEYDMIFMDIQMPVMNGYDATVAIRSSSRHYLQTIPIIAMTADAFTEDIQHCIDVGMNEHLSKPIDIEQLIDVIKKNKNIIYKK